MSGERGSVSRTFHGPTRAKQRHSSSAITLRALGDYFCNMQSGQEQSFLSVFKGDMCGIVWANKEIAVGGVQPSGGLLQQSKRNA